MKHESAAPLLLETLESKSEMNADLREHLDGCEDCRALQDMHGALARAFEGQDAPGSHLTSQDVVRLAMDRKDAAAPQDDGIRAHLRACARCAWEVRNVRSADAESSSEIPKGPVKAVEARSLSLNWPAIAAGFAVLALLYPAFLGTVRLPAVAEERRALLASEQESKGRMDALQGSLTEAQRLLERSTGWSGPVQVPVLSPAVRGREPKVAQIPIESGQPIVALALDLTAADRLVAPGIHHVRIQATGGSEAWSFDVPGGEILERTAVGGVLTLFVPAGKLPRGSYTLTVAPSSGAPIFEAPFTVTTGGFQAEARR